MSTPFRGSYVALPTPFRDGEVDFDALDRLVEFHVGKSDGLVVCGTSGESATLNDYERRSVIEAVVERSDGRLPVIAGVGTNATRSTIDLAGFAQAAGADGLLVVTPYYNKPTQRGLFAHFAELAESVEAPIVLYNVPSRTGVDLKPETVAALRTEYANIVAIKEASGSIGRAKELAASSDIALIAGEDALIADFVALGGAGVIGVVNNVVPAKVRELVRLAVPEGGNHLRAAMLVEEIAPLAKDLFVETNPVPVKAALAMLRKCGDEVRLPLAPLADASRAKLESTLRACKLL